MMVLLYKTNKAELKYSMLKSLDQYQISPVNNALILDSMEVLQQMRNVPNTFGFEFLALRILKNIINPLSTELFGDFYAYGTDLIFCYMD